jgi:hypothetical protein
VIPGPKEETLNLTSSARSALLVCALAVGLAGAAQKPKSTAVHKSNAPASGWQRWKSKTTGKIYRVKIAADHFEAEWVNIPPAARKQGAYIRSECRRAGTKWIGTTRAFLPCALPGPKKETRTCAMTFRFEVDSISPTRIQGAGETLKDFDCGKCQVLQTGWGKFVWVPEK